MFSPDISAPIYEKMKPAYGVQVGQWIQSMVISGLQANAISPIGRILRNYRYAQGNQTYAATIKPIENLAATDRSTLPGADLQNLQIIPQLISNLQGKMIKTEMEPTVSMIDSFSINQRVDREANLRIAMELFRMGQLDAQQLQQLGLTENEVPRDDIELRIQTTMMPQFVTEMNLEMWLMDVLECSKFDVVRKQVCGDLMINPGRSGYFLDRSLGKLQIKRLDPLNSGPLNFSLYEDGRDVAGYYFLEAVPLQQVRMDAQGQLTDEQLDSLKGGYFSQLVGGSYIWNANGYPYGGTVNNNFIDMVLIMRFEFTSTDTRYINTKDGKPFPPTYERKKQGIDGDVVEEKYQNLFAGNYICGYSDMIYDYGIVKDAIRQPEITGARYAGVEDPELRKKYTMADAKKVYANKVYGNFITYQPDMISGISKVPVDRAVPLADGFIQTWHKFRDAMGMYLPYFMYFDNSVIAEITMRENGEKLSAEDMIATAIKRGWILVDSTDLRNSATATLKDAILIQSNDSGPLSGLWELLVAQDRYMREAFGLPTVATGSTGGQTRPGKAVTEMVLQGADDTFSGLTFADIQLFQNLNETLMWAGLMEGGEGVVGGRPYSLEEGNPSQVIPKLFVEVKPKQEEWNATIAEAQMSKDAGILTADKVFMLKTITNLKQAQAYLSVEIKRGNERVQKEKMEAIRVTGEEQRASNQQTHDNALALEKQKAAGEQQREAIIAFGKLADTYLAGIMKPHSEGQSALNITEAKLALQELTDELKELYGTIGATTSTNVGSEPVGEPALL